MKTHFGIFLILLSVLLPGRLAAEEPFSFIALGDTDYEPETDDVTYQDLIRVINARNPAFSVHIGDTKGYGSCGAEFQEKQKALFNTFESALIYTPGNNEWADCWRAESFEADTYKILKILRETFYPNEFSLGQNPIPLNRESQTEGFEDFVENAMWDKGGILFVTLHLVGSGNNLVAMNTEMFEEFLSRDLANEAWIKKAFERVEAEGFKGVVFFFHSNIFDTNPEYRGGPFERVKNALKAGAKETKAEVLIVHGHYHELVIDTPWQEQIFATDTYTFGNVTRLQVPGWPQHKAVEVTVEPDTPWIWSFRPIFDENFLSEDFKKEE